MLVIVKVFTCEKIKTKSRGFLMDRTIRQIAEELKISKQKVYRYIKSNSISDVHQNYIKTTSKLHHDVVDEAHQKTSPKYYDDEVFERVKQYFVSECTSKDLYHEAHQNYIKTTSKLHHDVHQKKPFDTDFDVVFDTLKKELDNKDKIINDLMSELEKEREHNRLKDTQLMDTLNQLSQANTAREQKELASSIIEGKKLMNTPQQPKRSFIQRLFKKEL